MAPAELMQVIGELRDPALREARGNRSVGLVIGPRGAQGEPPGSIPTVSAAIARRC